MSSSPKPIAPLGLGCLSLAGLLFMCTSFGAAFFWYDEAESYENIAEMREADAAMGRGGGFLGPAYWRNKAEDYESYGMGSLCCGVVSLLMFFGGAIGAAITFRRYRAARAASASAAGTPPPGSGAPPAGFGPPAG